MNDTRTESETGSDRRLLVSEIFDSLQGEGASAGKPCRFLRLALCNLHCHFCDTKYTWDFARHDYEREVHEHQVDDLASELAGAPGRHLVVTGGEPLLQQRALVRLFSRLPHDLYLEIETNGTRVPLSSLCERVDQWNVSPKLASAGDTEALRIRPEALQALRDTGRAYLKLVVKTPSDLEEAEALRERFGFGKERTLLMPEAANREELGRLSPQVASWSQALGVRFSSRLHLLLWDGRRGT